MVPRDPRVLKGLGCGEPHLLVHHEELLDKVGALRRDLVPPLLLHVILPGPDGGNLQLLGATGEGHVAHEEDEDDDAEAPEVALRGVALVEDLRRHVGEGAAANVHLRVLLPDLAEAKVNELQEVVVLLLVEKVLQLQVPVHDPLAVDVIHGQEHLVGGPCGVLLGEHLPLRHAVEELAALHALHDKAQLALVLIHVHEPHDVGVVHAQEDLCLRHQLLLLLFADPMELKVLHGESRPIGLAPRKQHVAAAT
mmetsp:Transcript_15034/g.41624  ORF Transcript_15034/g.41624 Transcript_15034/m.41624 type:complete len:252 (+) Transcript_15034:862-1617(+)